MQRTIISKCAGIILFMLCLNPIHSIAQLMEKKVSSPEWALSLNAGVAMPFTDVKEKSVAPVFGIGAAYFVTPYFHLNLDLQKGWLKGGDDINNTSGLMGTKNSYYSVSLMGRFLPFGLRKDADNENARMNPLTGLYGGIGLGIVGNSVQSNAIVSSDFGSIGDYSGVAFMMPIEVGINVPVALLAKNRRLMVNANVRTNLCFSDKIDGYVPVVDGNKKNDAFDTFTLGLVYNF